MQIALNYTPPFAPTHGRPGNPSRVCGCVRLSYQFNVVFEEERQVLSMADIPLYAPEAVLELDAPEVIRTAAR